VRIALGLRRRAVAQPSRRRPGLSRLLPPCAPSPRSAGRRSGWFLPHATSATRGRIRAGAAHPARVCRSRPPRAAAAPFPFYASCELLFRVRLRRPGSPTAAASWMTASAPRHVGHFGASLPRERAVRRAGSAARHVDVAPCASSAFARPLPSSRRGLPAGSSPGLTGTHLSRWSSPRHRCYPIVHTRRSSTRSSRPVQRGSRVPPQDRGYVAKPRA